MFAVVDESADEAVDALGERGWAAALDNGTWDVVARRTLDAIGRALRDRRRARASKTSYRSVTRASRATRRR